jgi:hypothetical protein
MKVLERLNEAEQKVLEALSASQDRVVEGVTTARSAVAQASDRLPDRPKVELPEVELPAFGEIVDNLTDFWQAVLEHNRAFAHRLHGAVTATPKAKKAPRARTTRSTGARSTGARSRSAKATKATRAA